jgi:hypothetical protein
MWREQGQIERFVRRRNTPMRKTSQTNHHRLRTEGLSSIACTSVEVRAFCVVAGTLTSNGRAIREEARRCDTRKSLAYQLVLAFSSSPPSSRMIADRWPCEQHRYNGLSCSQTSMIHSTGRLSQPEMVERTSQLSSVSCEVESEPASLGLNRTQSINRRLAGL